MSETSETEQKIFEAARYVFHEHGFEGARMQQIADRAEINKAMLHYYYRSKEKLFEAVFRVSALKVLPKVMHIARGDLPLADKLTRVVHAYIDLLRANPHLPGFVLQELRRNPAGLRKFMGRQTEGVFEKLKAEIVAAVERGEIRPIEPEHLLTNVIGLCVFPFIARPMIEALTGMDEARYEAYLEERKVVVADFILNALKP